MKFVIVPETEGEIVLGCADHVEGCTGCGGETFLDMEHITDALAATGTGATIAKGLVEPVREVDAALGKGGVTEVVDLAGVIATRFLVA